MKLREVLVAVNLRLYATIGAVLFARWMVDGLPDDAIGAAWMVFVVVALGWSIVQWWVDFAVGIRR